MVLQAQTILSTLYGEIAEFSTSKSIPTLKAIILPTPASNDDEGTDNEDHASEEHDVLKQLLIKEEQIRLSSETQQLLASIEDRKDIEWMDIIADLQTHLIREEIGVNATDEEIQHGLR